MENLHFIGGELTAQESKVLGFIKDYISNNGCSPTNKEIADFIKIKSRGVVHRYLRNIEIKGYICLLSNQKRNIQLTFSGSAVRSDIVFDISQEANIPILGSIAAGYPIEAVANHDALDITKLFLGPGRYALRVKGDSMIEDGIFDGDIVVCQQSKTAHKNQVVVALIDQDYVTLKRIDFEKPDTIILKPANASHNVQKYNSSRVSIQGVLIGLLRVSY